MLKINETILMILCLLIYIMTCFVLSIIGLKNKKQLLLKEYEENISRHDKLNQKTDLEKYIDFMTKEHNQFSWEIGWESLPKYIGHKIYNLNTKQVAIVNWDRGFPQLLDLSGKEIVCCCADFRGDNAFWIYKVGENYNGSNKQSMEQINDLSDIVRIVKENIGDEFAREVERIYREELQNELNYLEYKTLDEVIYRNIYQ